MHLSRRIPTLSRDAAPAAHHIEETSMSTLSRAVERTRGTNVSPLVGWLLIAGGVIYFVGGSMHPKEDPVGVSLKERLRIMYEDSAWFPAHTVFLVGMVLLAAALVVLPRGGGLRVVGKAHTAAVVAAVATTAAAAGSLLHLLSGSEADRIASGASTPLTDVLLVAETIYAPAFGLSIAALAVVGAMTHTLGNWPATVFGVVGGLAYALAGGTFLLTDALDPLFPVASAIAVWAVIAGVVALRRPR
jgi:hypothetical protein